MAAYLKRTRLRKVSSKRAEELKKYSKLRDKFLSDQPWCEIGVPGCTRKSRDVHHGMRRGKYLNDRRYFFATCRHCHNWIEANKREARKKGFILYK